VTYIVVVPKRLSANVRKILRCFAGNVRTVIVVSVLIVGKFTHILTGAFRHSSTRREPRAPNVYASKIRKFTPSLIIYMIILL
jgi:hypothetical protein